MNATPTIPRTAVPTRASRSTFASSSTGMISIATLPPETTSRCVSPVAWKSRSVAGIELRVVAERQPQQQPGLAGRQDAFDRAADDAAASTASRARTRWATARAARCRRSAGPAALPLPASASRNPGSSGTWRTPSTRTRSPRASSPGGSSPSIQIASRSVAAPPRQVTSRAATTACHPYAPGRGSSRRVPVTVTRGRRQPAEQRRPRRASACPAQPDAEAQHPGEEGRGRDERQARGGQRPRPDRGDAGDSDRARDRADGFDSAARAARRGGRRTTNSRRPRASRPNGTPGGMDPPREQAAPEGGGSGRDHPATGGRRLVGFRPHRREVMVGATPAP